MNKLKQGIGWLIAGVLIAVIVTAGYDLVTGDDEASAGERRTTTTTTKPEPEFKVTDLVPPGPNQKKLLIHIDEVDMSAYLTKEFEGWRVGLVDTIVSNNTMKVTVSEYTDVFYEGGCHSENDLPDSYLKTLLDPGDVILYSTLGEDHELCIGEIRLIDER